jgi:hypothetical protein
MKAVYNFRPETCEEHNFCQLCVKNNKEVGTMHQDVHLQKYDTVLSKQEVKH